MIQQLKNFGLIFMMDKALSTRHYSCTRAVEWATNAIAQCVTFPPIPVISRLCTAAVP